MLKCICCTNDEKEHGLNKSLRIEKTQYYKHKEFKEETIENIRKDIEKENKIVTFDMNNYTHAISSKLFSHKTMCICNGSEKDLLQYVFTSVKVLFLFNCHSKFVYTNLNTHTFPNLYRLYSTSHPSEYSVMHRHQNNPGYIGYISTEYYNKYFELWWDDDIEHIKVMDKEIIRDIYDKYIKVDFD